MDIFIASAGILAGVPVFLLVALLIKLDSPGPVLFKQPRLGQRQHIFNFYKFRTMYVNHQYEGPKPTSHDDERVTRIGRWLRRTSLDELPQLLNIVRGEMSLVGPRPEQLFLLVRYPPAMHRRFEVVPGLTGWWQVNGRRQPMYENLDYDIYYVDHQSLWLDLKILLLTVRAVLRGEGAI